MPLVRGVILWLFFFNALLDRLMGHYFGLRFFTNLFYGLILFAIAVKIGSFLSNKLRASVLLGTTILFLVFALVLGALYGDPLASLHGIKQFFFGAVLLLIMADNPPSPRQLLIPVLWVQAYAAFQIAYFLSNGNQLPPWDAEFVSKLLETKASQNLFVDGVLRPFATFSSFFEYQVSVHAITAGLYLTRLSYDRRTRRLATLTLLILVVLDIVIPERTPIMIAAITFAVAWGGSHLVLAAYRRSARLALGAIGVALAVTIAIAAPALWSDSANPMLRRTAETFRFWKAETVNDRVVIWERAIATVRMHPEGVGPAEVATAYNPQAQVPHNNFLLFAIGYSIGFPVIFFIYVLGAFWPLFRGVLSADALWSRMAFTSVGLILGYVIAGQFNAPFSSYPGAALFLVLAVMYACVRPSADGSRPVET